MATSFQFSLAVENSLELTVTVAVLVQDQKKRHKKSSVNEINKNQLI